MSKSVVVVMIILILQSAFCAQAQSTRGVLQGTLRSAESHEAVYGGIIVIVGSTLGGVTDTAGNFSIAGIPAGTYQIRASALGYAPRIVRDVPLRAGESTCLDIVLNEQSIQAGEVLISGTKLTDAAALPQSIHYVEYKEMHNTAGAFDDVVRTVSILPGMAQMKPEHNDLFVRGGSSTENLFLIDNIEVANINHFGSQGSSGGTMSFINFEFIENLTFSNGGFGVQYGDKLSSVLKLSMRNGRTDRQRGKATISATMAGLNLEGPIKGESSYLFSVRRSYLDPVFKYYGFGFIPIFWDFLGKANFQIDRYNTIELLGVAAIDRMAVNNVTDQNRYDNERMIFSDQNFIAGGVTWRHGFENGTFTLTGRKSYGDYNYNQTATTFKSKFINISYEDETSLRADAEVRAGASTTLSAGGDARLIQLDSRMVASVTVTGFTEFPKTIPVDTAQRTSASKASAYAQASQTIGRCIITLGARADYFSMIRNQTVVSPRASFAYLLSAATKFTLSAGMFHQAPSYIWLMTNPYNSVLNHLAMRQYVAGVEHFLTPDLRVSVEAYQKEYSNYPVSITRPYMVMANAGTDVTDIAEAYIAFGLDYLGSLGKGTTRGIDILVEKRLSELPLYGRLGISISEAHFTALDGVSRYGSNDQRLIVNVGAGYIFNEKWEVTSTLKYSSGRPYSPVGITSYYQRTSTYYNTARTDANHRMDLRISRRWDTSPIVLVSYIDIQNLYNRPWRDIPFYSDRNHDMEIPNSTGIVPSVGITAEF